MVTIAERLQTKKARIAFSVLFAALGILCLFFPGRTGKLILYERTTREGQKMISRALLENGAAFATVSAVKGALAIVEGSAVGVGFKLEIGDIVQPAYDYVDFVWRVFLWAVVMLTFYQVLLDTGILALGIPTAGVGLLLLAAGTYWNETERGLRLWGRRLFAFGLLFTYIVPVALLGSNLLGEHYTRPLKERHGLRMQAVQQELRQAERDVIGLKDSIAISAPAESLERIRTAITHAAYTMARLGKDGLAAFLYYVVALLFELLVLPFATALLLYFLGRFVLARIMETPVFGSKPRPRNAE